MNAVDAFLKGKSYSHIIWDWNGTLLDDFQLCYIHLREEMIEADYPDQPESHRELFRFPVKDFIKDWALILRMFPTRSLPRSTWIFTALAY